MLDANFYDGDCIVVREAILNPRRPRAGETAIQIVAR
jgi:hypothetical protein